MKIALVHDWLTGMRGGEKVLEILCEIFPDAHLFTLVHKKGSVSPVIERMKITTSYLQQLPFGVSKYQHYLPFYPAAAKSLNISGYDLMISSSHAAAKAITVPPGTKHICYCHTPMRYIWDQYEQYFGKERASLPVRLVMKSMLGYLRGWDVRSARHVDEFIANSRNVQERIKRIYNRESTVIYPPLDTTRFAPTSSHDGSFLIVSALVPYKRVDIAVEAFNHTGDKLIIVGEGPEKEKLKALARPHIEFKGWAGDDELPKNYARCRALIFPGEEDFGIVPLEAMASGKPVIAFARGGVLETVIEGRTGTFFPDQSAESLVAALGRFKSMTFSSLQIRQHAMKFDKEVFRSELRSFIERHS